ncbi:MAG: NAD(P)-dependent oxidoreductase [Microvirga sp.]|jgi:nucleoside-diphosphate-sugar epimerase|nr:NAD(P)-dependent oxidoreductase [Microvirga sp.]
MNLFVFGLGYSARHFIRRHRARLGEVAGTTTSPEAAAALKGEGVRALLFDGETADPAIAAALAGAELLIASIPPDGRGDPALRSFEEAITAAPRLSWIGYLSTVGVYGDHGGRWVDETTPPAPANDRSRDRAAAEEAWLGLGVRSGKAVQVFRLAGIYGPGRNALAQLAAGTARCIVKPGQVFNRIHVDDIAAVLTASVERPNPGRIYNLADDQPAPPQDVVAYAARLAGVVPPPEVAFEEARLSGLAASFYAECKRVSNRRIKQELGPHLSYPTYREGLRALREAGEGPSSGQAA